VKKISRKLLAGIARIVISSTLPGCLVIDDAPTECDSRDECLEGYVCGDTRVCSLPCDGACPGVLVCRPELGYCSEACITDDDCDTEADYLCDTEIGVCFYKRTEP